MVIFPELELISEIDIISNWHNSHIISLTHGGEIIMVRKTKWKPLELPLNNTTLIGSQKPHCIPEGTAEVSAILKDWKVISGTSSFHLLLRLVQKTGGSGRMTVDYINLTSRWLQLQLLYQKRFHCLIKLTYRLVPGM